MGFYEVLAQVIELLQREGRTSYRALKRQFHLDDDYLEDLKVELIDVKQLAMDQDGKMLVWTDAPATTVSPPMPSQERPPLSYTPPYLAEKSRTTRSALAGERKQVTVLFADLKDSTDASKKPIGRRSGRATPVRNSLCLCAHKHMRGVIVLTVACQRPSYISKQQMTQTQRGEREKCM